MTTTTAIPVALEVRDGIGPRLRRNLELLIGIVIVLLVALMGLLAPWIAPYDPVATTSNTLAVPSAEHLFGTDQSGFDVFSRVVWSPRVDLLIAVSGTLLAAVIGTPLGALAGYRGGRTGGFISRSMDVVQAFPFFILAMCLLAIFGGTVQNIILVLGIVNAPIYCRLMASQTMTLKDRTFIQSALVSGARQGAILFHHILPNAIGPILAQMSVTLGMSIILTAGVSFVGAGVPAPTPEWGVMIGSGAGGMFTGQWWPVLFPGLALAVTVMGFALISNGISKLADPRRKHG